MVEAGVIAGIVVGVSIAALLLALVIIIALYCCIYRQKKRRYKKGHVTTNGTPIVYSKPQPVDVVSANDNVFTIPTPVTKQPSVYSLQNGSTLGGTGGSVILQPAYKSNYDTTDRVFLTMPTRTKYKRKPTKAKRILSDEMWNSRFKSLVKKDHSRSMDELDSRPVHVQYPASIRTRSASEYGSQYGSTPSLLRVHKAMPVKTKDNKTVYVIDNTNVASQSVVMAPSGRVTPPLTHTRPVARAYSANNSFDLVDHTNTHLFESASMARGATATRSVPHSPRRHDDVTRGVVVPGNDNIHLVWSETMRNRLEEKDHVRHHSDASSMASLPRRQRAPAEHVYSYDADRQTLTAL